MNTLVAEQKDKKVYTNAALNIGKYLAKEAIWHEDKCNWISHEVTMIDGHHVNAIQACKTELYSGLSGISWFLAELYNETKDPIILHTLNGALNTILSNLSSNQLNNYGYYSGKIGVGFTLWRIGKKLQRDELMNIGIGLVKSVKKDSLQEHEIDIISGAAGSISALLRLYYQTSDNDFLELANRCGEFLLEKAIIESDTYCWMTVDPNYALTGFSHGASGIASALLELYAATKKDAFWYASMGGYEYEKKWYSEQVKNWPDLRNYLGSGPLQYGNMWCHGAPGQAIAYLKAYEMTKQDSFLQFARIAIQTTSKGLLHDLQNNLQGNYSLCHGLAGNADILLFASDMLNDSNFKRIAERVGDRGIELFDKTSTLYPSGVNDPSGKTSGQQENIGLMLGLSGTGMFYLRLANSQKVLSPLVP